MLIPSLLTNHKYNKIALSALFIFAASSVYAGSSTAAYYEQGCAESGLRPGGMKSQEISQGRNTWRLGDTSPGKERNEDMEGLNELQKQARYYRQEGLDLQSMDNLDGAMTLYQKAVELDPAYAVAYNDLGVIYEAKGYSDRAGDSYLKALKVDPDYLSPYSNLALFYENRRDLGQAAYYWQKRAEMGSPSDPWTMKAKQRLGDIRKLSPDYERASKEQEMIDLIKDVSIRKYTSDEDNKELSQDYFEEAKKYYDKDDYATAIKKALDAIQLDPDNIEILAFIEKTQIRALSR